MSRGETTDDLGLEDKKSILLSNDTSSSIEYCRGNRE